MKKALSELIVQLISWQPQLVTAASVTMAANAKRADVKHHLHSEAAVLCQPDTWHWAASFKSSTDLKQ